VSVEAETFDGYEHITSVGVATHLEYSVAALALRAAVTPTLPSLTALALAERRRGSFSLLLTASSFAVSCSVRSMPSKTASGLAKMRANMPSTTAARYMGAR
jgi:hypothetical protein